MKRTWKRIVMLAFAALWMFCVTAMAEGASGDNSLYSLGLENASSCSPDFYYSTLEYNVTVPAGTEELYLSPVTSNSEAVILDISGTILDESGNGTVYVTVEAPNGAQVSYILYVTSEGEPAETEPETEDAAAAEQARIEEEQRLQAESEEALRREAEMKANEEKITKLSTENEQLAERLDILLKVLYGLVAFAVILLFFIINQSLRNKDLKDDLKEARSQADKSNEFARKEQNMRTDYYYAPVNGMNQNYNAPVQEPAAPTAAPIQEMTAPVGMSGADERPIPTEPAQNLSKKELKKMEKAAKKAEKANRGAAPQAAPVQDTFVQATIEEPDVNVDMIDL